MSECENVIISATEDSDVEIGIFDENDNVIIEECFDSIDPITTTTSTTTPEPTTTTTTTSTTSTTTEAPADAPYQDDMLVWYNAGDISASDNDAISSWVDSSQWEKNATAPISSTYYPTYKTNQINGHPAIRFAGDYLNCPLIFYKTSAPSHGVPSSAEIFGIIKIDADPPATEAASGLWSFGNVVFMSYTHYPNTNGTIYDVFGTNGQKTVGNPTPSLTSWRLYNVGSGTNNWFARLDGELLYSTSTNTTSFSGLYYNGIGAEPYYAEDGDGPFLYGYIAEIIIYNHILDETERGNVNSYFANKYDLTIS
jgi:hypothetical protein